MLPESAALERLVELLQEEFGADLRAVWLYGSRARGERPVSGSDIDVLVVASGNEWHNLERVVKLEDEAARGIDTRPVLSTLVYSPERLAQRREIRSFFIHEVDRDKIVLAGEL